MDVTYCQRFAHRQRVDTHCLVIHRNQLSSLGLRSEGTLSAAAAVSEQVSAYSASMLVATLEAGSPHRPVPSRCPAGTRHTRAALHSYPQPSSACVAVLLAVAALQSAACSNLTVTQADYEPFKVDNLCGADSFLMAAARPGFNGTWASTGWLRVPPGVRAYSSWPRQAAGAQLYVLVYRFRDSKAAVPAAYGSGPASSGPSSSSDMSAVSPPPAASPPSNTSSAKFSHPSTAPTNSNSSMPTQAGSGTRSGRRSGGNAAMTAPTGDSSPSLGGLVTLAGSKRAFCTLVPDGYDWRGSVFVGLPFNMQLAADGTTVLAEDLSKGFPADQPAGGLPCAAFEVRPYASGQGLGGGPLCCGASV